MNKVKQGQTKWKSVVYDPNTIEGYDNEYVACVFRCFVTKVEGNFVYYTCGDDGYYICSNEFWNNKLHKTFRKAYKESLLELNNKF